VRIGVDATSWSNRRGFGRFARNAVGRLVERDHVNEYVLYVDPQANGFPLPPGAVVRPLAAGATRPAEQSRPASELVRFGWAVSRDRLDAVLFPSVYSYFPVVGVPTVVGVHDVIADQLPGLTLPTRRSRLLWRLKEGLAVRRATRVFTVSAASRDAVGRRFGLGPERLAVVPEAPDPVFAPRPAAAVRAALEPLGLEQQRFFVYAGGISPHKNLELLIDAYAAFAEREADAPSLVVVGDVQDNSYLSAGAAVRRRIAAHRLQGRVLLPGFVTDEALACLYAGAKAAVLPSLAEGFGLPAVEAAACGAPVVLSDLPAHRETLGGAGLFFPPRRRGALEAALRRVHADDVLRATMSERGSEAVRRMTWDATADRLAELVAAAGGRR
jgi:glycosyltransferase involved in cell wall biosynthesis